MSSAELNSIDNHGSDEKHAESHGDDFTPMNSTETGNRRKQLFENMLVLEIFAGSSNLSVEIRKAHLRGVAVDKTIGRAKGPITVLDLTLEKDVEFLAEFIRQDADNICLIHFAPPCGTCSAARKRRLSPAVLDKLASEGITPPQVLRSEAFPMGLPSLKGLDAMKVGLANKLYWATNRLVKLALSLHIRVSIENPTNSLFWKTEPMVDLFKHCAGYMNRFHSCMMGGERDKQTAWWCNDMFFNSFNLECIRDHAHKPWSPSITADGVYYPTKEEAEYPPILCKRVTSLVLEELEQRGIVRPETFTEQIKVHRNTAVNSVAMGLLPRGQKLRPLVSEFASYNRFAVLPHFNADKVIDKQLKGSRITARKLWMWGDLRVSSPGDISFEFLDDLEEIADSTTVEILTVGVPREPLDFVQQAAMVGHPRFLPYAGTPQMDELISANLAWDTTGLVSMRSEFFNKWLQRARDLADDEKKLQSELPTHVRNVLRGKRLLLFRDILAELDYPDKSLFDDIVSGFKLSGWMRDSMVFTSLPRPPKISLDTLLESSAGLQKAVLRQVADPEDAALHAAAWEETQLECERGWIWEDDRESNAAKIIAHRFGIRQNEKVRVSDNFKECGLNDACGLPEKFVLHGVDYIAASLIRALALSGSSSSLIICGKTFDLKSAYKQYPIHSTDREHLRIAIHRQGARGCSGLMPYRLGRLEVWRVSCASARHYFSF